MRRLLSEEIKAGCGLIWSTRRLRIAPANLCPRLIGTADVRATNLLASLPIGVLGSKCAVLLPW